MEVGSVAGYEMDPERDPEESFSGDLWTFCRYDLADSSVGADGNVNVVRIEFGPEDMTVSLAQLGVDGPGVDVPGLGEHAVWAADVGSLVVWTGEQHVTVSVNRFGFPEEVDDRALAIELAGLVL